MPNSYYRPVLLWLHITATVSSKRLLLACLPWPLPQLVTSQALLSRPLLSQPQLVTPQELSSCPPFIPSTFGYITSTAALPSFPSQPRLVTSQLQAATAALPSFPSQPRLVTSQLQAATAALPSFPSQPRLVTSQLQAANAVLPSLCHSHTG